MPDDMGLVERLKAGNLAYMSDSGPVWEGGDALHREAAAAIERLLAARDEARRELYLARNDRANLADHVLLADGRRAEMAAALRPFLGDETMETLLWGDLPDSATGTVSVTLADFRRARQALQDSKP